MAPSPYAQPMPGAPRVRTMAQDLTRARRTQAVASGSGTKQRKSAQEKKPESITLKSLRADEEDILAPYRQRKSSLQTTLEEEERRAAAPGVPGAFDDRRAMPRPAGNPRMSAAMPAQPSDEITSRLEKMQPDEVSSYAAAPLRPLQQKKDFSLSSTTPPPSKNSPAATLPPLTPPPIPQRPQAYAAPSPLEPTTKKFPPPIIPSAQAGLLRTNAMTNSPNPNKDSQEARPSRMPTPHPLPIEEEEMTQPPRPEQIKITAPAETAPEKRPLSPPLERPRVPAPSAKTEPPQPPPLAQRKPAELPPQNLTPMESAAPKTFSLPPRPSSASPFANPTALSQLQRAGTAADKETAANVPSASETVTPKPAGGSFATPENAPSAPGTPKPRPSLQEEIAAALRQTIVQQEPPPPSQEKPETVPSFSPPYRTDGKSFGRLGANEERLQPYGTPEPSTSRPTMQTPEEILRILRPQNTAPSRPQSSASESFFSPQGQLTPKESQSEPLQQGPGQKPFRPPFTQSVRGERGFPLPAEEQKFETSTQKSPPGGEGPTELSLDIEQPRKGFALGGVFRGLAFLFGILLVLGGVGGFVYVQMFHGSISLPFSLPFISRPAPAPSPASNPTPETQKPPSALFAPAYQRTIQIPAGQEQNLRAQIAQVAQSDHPQNSLGHLRIQKSDGAFATTQDLLRFLSISVPSELTKTFDAQYMLYLYTPGTEEQQSCTGAGITDAACSSSRLGLAIKLRTGQEDKTRAQLQDLQGDLVSALAPLVLGSPTLEGIHEWGTATYRGLGISYPSGIAVSYTNLPLSTTALNYALVKSYLVIATSKNSSYYAMDELVKVVDPGGIAK